MPGYSGTPLARKLSLKDGLRAWWEDVPDAVRDEIEREGLVLAHLAAPEAPIEAAHIFVTEYADMAARLARLRPLLAPAGFIWVSWPKKASGVATDITEGRIRDSCGVGRAPGTTLDCRGQSNPARLPDIDLVDVKVCAVDSTGSSGLKLMNRRAAR